MATAGILLVTALFALLAVPLPGAAPAAAGHRAPVLSLTVHPLPVRAAPHAGPAPAAVPHPATGYPRTVLVETFTGTWCPHCPLESQGLFSIEHNYSKSFVAISELHIQDQYTDKYGIDNARNSYYPVCGYPDVFFDGGHDVCGAPFVGYGTAAQEEAIYYSAILNASAFPGNVSIAQSAIIVPGPTGTLNVSVHANVTSALTGSYHAWTYLMEYIGVNDSTGHDIMGVLRGAPINEMVSLTAGTTTPISGTLQIAPSWKLAQLSVVTFIQNETTRVIENTNFAEVTGLTAGGSAGVSTIASRMNTTVTIHVTNSTTGAAIPGASVALSPSSGGNLTPSSGTTGTDGTFSSVFTAPTVTSVVTDLITGQVTAPGYKPTSVNIAVTVDPEFAPTVPLGVGLQPVDSQVSLQWSAPASGGGGLVYHVYRSTSATGTFVQVGTSTTFGYADPNVAQDQAYWYAISAQDTAGFSPNTTAVEAVPVVGIPSGLPGALGWWLIVGSNEFNATGATSVGLHLLSGLYTFSLGVDSYDYLPPQTASGTIAVASAEVQIAAAFSPNFAQLQGTVSPATATVVFNGSSVALAGGAFQEQMMAGHYPLVISAPGYVTNSSTVTLTPGNLTSLTVHLTPVPSTGAGTSSGGLSNTEMLALVGVAIVAVAALAVGLLWGRNRGRRGNGGGSD